VTARPRRACGARAGINWSRVPLGTRPDYEIARGLGVVASSVGQARRARGISAFPRGLVERLGAASALIGTAPDRVVAARLGVSVSNVVDARRRAGLSRAEHSAAQPSVDWDRLGPLLGTLPDLDLARREGVSVAIVHRERNQRGIPRYRTPRTCACGRPFAGTFRSSRFCSLRCAWAANGARQWGRAPSPEAERVQFST